VGGRSLSGPRVEIYTDGGCDPNPGPGGWGAVLLSGKHRKEMSGADPATTNNRMELTAAIEALRNLKVPCDVTLYTDSEYLRNGITRWVKGWQARGWRKANGQPVENRDLWEALLHQARRHTIDWRWVRGHQGNPLNERADQLATEARRKLVSERRGGTSSSSGTNRPDNGRHMDAVALYVRGCALGVPGPGGYAAVLVEETGAEAVASGHWPSATNNVMELWAVIAGLRTLKRPSRVTVYTPSKYLYEGASRWLADWERRRWRTRDGRPVKHREVWTELVHMMGDHDISWKLVPAARAGVHGERAARVARQEAEKAAGQAGASAGE
jgi:ribonuclease HI